MRTMTRLTLSGAGVGVAGLVAALALAIPANAATTAPPPAVTYQATLTAVPLNTPAGAASGEITVTLNGDQATVNEKVTGLATNIPTDPTTLAALGIPAAFAGKPFPHVQHIHINGDDQCPVATADTNGDGAISTVEGKPAYGGIGTTLSISGSTDPSVGTDVTVAPGGGDFTYTRTFTINADTVAALQANKAVVVVHGLNPANAPKASLTTPSSLGVTLPGADKVVAMIATAPALCGVLQAVATPPVTPVVPAPVVPGVAVNTGGVAQTSASAASWVAGGSGLAGVVMAIFAIVLYRRKRQSA